MNETCHKYARVMARVNGARYEMHVIFKKKGFEQIELPEKLRDDFLPSDKRNINQSIRVT